MKTPIRQSIRAFLLGSSIVCLSCPAPAASASELLEKGIFQEETVGDLDVAITIYQQLLGDAKNAQALAAQAQFRLGQCYLKKNRPVDAATAFERVIRDYPEQKELVANARGHLPADVALQPVPWTDGERLQYNLTVGSGLDIGTAEYRAVLREMGGRKVWEVGARMFAGAHSVSRVSADVKSFAPISSVWKHGLLGEATATFGPGEIEIARVGKEPTKVAVEKTVYDNEQGMHLMRRLPLEVGYKATVPLVASLAGATPIALGIEVTAKETIKVPAGEFECFRLNLSNAQTFWFSTDAHRYLVRFDAGGATASLASIAHRGVTDPVVFQNEAAGISLSAPPDWVLHLQATDDETNRPTLHMLDPNADARAIALRIRQTDKLSAKARAGVRAWAEIDFTDHLAKTVKNPKLRPDSWRPFSVSGRAGMSYIADFTEKDEPMVVYSIYALGAKLSEEFSLACAVDKFEALRPAFEKIVSSYRSK
jgi:hypothetical protein